MELQPGAYFKVGNQGFEYVGIQRSSDVSQGVSIVGRVNPDQALTKGALHRSFSPQQLEEEGVKIGPFCEALPYSDYVLEKLAWESRFPGSEKAIVHPSQDVVAALLRAKEQGIETLEPHAFPQMMFTKENITIMVEGKEKTYPYPKDWVKPNDFFFDNIGKPNGIPLTSATIPAQWVLVDNTPKPPYDNGQHLYPHDPFIRLITQLESDPNSGIHPSGPGASLIFQGSRFDITWNQRAQHFDPLLAETLGIPQEQQDSVRVPTELEFNTIGNMHHREWGETDTSESLNDNFGTGHRLRGGFSGLGGLADVGYWQSDLGFDRIGFRPLVAFPSKA